MAVGRDNAEAGGGKDCRGAGLGASTLGVGYEVSVEAWSLGGPVLKETSAPAAVPQGKRIHVHPCPHSVARVVQHSPPTGLGIGPSFTTSYSSSAHGRPRQAGCCVPPVVDPGMRLPPPQPATWDPSWHPATGSRRNASFGPSPGRNSPPREGEWKTRSGPLSIFIPCRSGVISTSTFTTVGCSPPSPYEALLTQCRAPKAGPAADHPAAGPGDSASLCAPILHQSRDPENGAGARVGDCVVLGLQDGGMPTTHPAGAGRGSTLLG